MNEPCKFLPSNLLYAMNTRVLHITYTYIQDIEKNTKDYTERFANPMVAAERGFIDDIIEPSMTRAIICRDIELLKNKQMPQINRKISNIPL